MGAQVRHVQASLGTSPVHIQTNPSHLSWSPQGALFVSPGLLGAQKPFKRCAIDARAMREAGLEVGNRLVKPTPPGQRRTHCLEAMDSMPVAESMDAMDSMHSLDSMESIDFQWNPWILLVFHIFSIESIDSMESIDFHGIHGIP